MAHKLSTGRKVVYGLIAVAGIIVILETILRLAGMFPADRLFEKRTSSASWQENLFAGFMGIHQPDPDLLWVMKPNLNKSFVNTNSHGLTGPEVEHKKPPGKFRILLLGDSTPLGIGLPNWNRSFVWQIAEILRNQMNMDAEIINASTAGYSSLQGLKYFKQEGLKYNPDLVLMYLGNNDASYNGYRSDSALMAEAEQFLGIKKVLNSFKTYRLLKSLLLPIKSELADKAQGQLVLRVDPENYRRNLEEIITICRENEIDIILNTIPVPLTWPPGVEFKVFRTGRDTVSGTLFMPELQREILSEKKSLALDWQMFRNNYGSFDPWSLNVLKSAYTDTGAVEENIRQYHQLLDQEPGDSRYLNNLGVLYWKKQVTDSALKYLRDASEIEIGDAPILYNLGMAHRQAGNADSAEYYLNRARDNDYNSLRIKSGYNHIISALAHEHEIPFIDFVQIFNLADREKLFVDHCHPDPTGHRMLAEKFAEKIASITEKP